MARPKDQSRLQKFSCWLRNIAQKKGFESQRQLAIKAGINEATISRIWNATQLPDEVTIAKLATALNIDESIIMWEAGYKAQYTYDNREMAKKYFSEIVSQPDKYSAEDIAKAYEEVLIGYFFRSVQETPIDVQHPSQKDYISMLLYTPHMKDSRLSNDSWKILIDKYGTIPGIKDGYTSWYIHRIPSISLPSVTPINSSFHNHGETVSTFALSRSDNPDADLPEDAQKQIEDFRAYIRQKYKKPE